MRGSRARRSLGLVLLLLATVPWYRLLDTPATGTAGAATLGMAESYAAYSWTGSLVVLLLGVLLALLLPAARAERAAATAARLLLAPSLPVFAAGCALASTALAGGVVWLVFHGQPPLIDAISQLVQARYVAAGTLHGPVSPLAAFWHLQQTVLTANGWVSQYPPGHLLLLAVGLRLGVVAWIGPALLGGTVFMTALLAHRLFAADRVTARLGVLALALSPFASAHAAAYMNHVTAAFLAVTALYAFLRAAEGGGARWALLLGGTLAPLFATRPLSAVVAGAVILLCWSMAWFGRPRPARGVQALLAALPLLALLAWYQAHFFGHPLRFGYLAALGPHAGLGFGTDPWGNTYGLRAALGYTGADLTALNVFLLETPVPAVVLVACFLLLVRRLDAPVRLLVAWTVLPLVAHFGYWHHGQFMGPRMLNEYAPAWCLLLAAAATGLVRHCQAALRHAPRWSPRVALGGALAVAWTAAIFWGGPFRLASYRLPPDLGVDPGDSAGPPRLVFVHGSWNARLAMQLAAAGMRLDSVDLVMRAHSACAIQRALDAGGPMPPAGRPGEAPPLRQFQLGPGSRIRVLPGEPWPASCARQASSDRGGVVELAHYLWREGLPGLEADATMFVRDLGPELNARLIEMLARPAFVLRASPGGSPPSYEPYPAGMAALWHPGAGRQSAAPARRTPPAAGHP